MRVARCVVEEVVHVVDRELRVLVDQAGPEECDQLVGRDLADAVLDRECCIGLSTGGSFAFETGRGQFAVTDEAVQWVGIELRGASGVVRARGSLRWDGEVDLVLFKTGERGAEALAALPLDASPGQWIRAVPADFAAYRVSGTVRAPHARPIGGLDPAFGDE